MTKLLRIFSLAGLVALAPFPLSFCSAYAGANIVNSGEGGGSQLTMEQLLEGAQHDAVAMNNVGLRYKNGQGVPVDYTKAMYWYQKAYKAGNLGAAGNIGMLFAQGLGVKQDYQVAMEWFRTAWKKSHLDDTGEGKVAAGAAANNIGFFYEKGWGVKQDLNKAYEWYQKGIGRGYSTAFNNAAVLLWNHGNQEQKNAAIDLWQQAARMGNSGAQNELRQLGKGW